MKDKIALHQYVLLGVAVFLLLIKFVFGNLSWNLGILWWLLGMILGFIFVFTDRFFYSFLMKPSEALGMRLRDLLGEKKFSEGLVTLLNERHEQKELVMRSFLFVVVWIFLAIWTTTSVSSQFARGLMLGIGAHLVFDLIYDFNFNPEKFNLWFWQIKREIKPEEKRWFVILTTAIFGLLALSF